MKDLALRWQLLLTFVTSLLALAGTIEGQGRDADALAFFRDETAFRNCLLVEQPNGDFAVTIVRLLRVVRFATSRTVTNTRASTPATRSPTRASFVRSIQRRG